MSQSGTIPDQIQSGNNSVALSPESIESLGLPGLMVHDLVLRYLREHGSASLSVLRKDLKLSYLVADSIFRHLRQQQFVEVKSSMGIDFLFALTTAGQQYAAERSQTCRYAGPAPVPLNQYARVVRSQRIFPTPTEEGIRNAFAELVLPDATLDQIGQAFVSARPIFIYGEAGNGKTSIIERFGRIFDDSVLVPFAVEIDGQIVSLFDPRVHRPLGVTCDGMDERWVRCQRPRVITAGELTPAMLNLRLDESSGTYTAPVQMKANNGVLLIDDFGRQAISPTELLNRWIMPLDRRVDYLSLRHGLTFQVPFELIVAFATNLDPSELADEAFLRRVPTKIYMGPVSDEQFDRIFERVLQWCGSPSDPEMSQYLRRQCRTRNRTGLRACYPRDICEIMLASAQYKRRPFALSRQYIDEAVESYFAHSAFSPESQT